MTLIDTDLSAISDDELGEILDGLFEAGACPHCDGLHNPQSGTSRCWCIGCDACDARRDTLAMRSAYEAEARRRWEAFKAANTVYEPCLVCGNYVDRDRPCPFCADDEEPF